MSRRPPSLNPEDRRALDLLLDRSSSVVGTGIAGFTEAGVSQERLAAAQRVLQTLDLLPAEEPPADLLDRTLRRVGETPDEFRPTLPGFGSGAGRQQAHA